MYIAIFFIAALSAVAKNAAQLTFCCAPDNDLFLALKKYSFPRFETPLAAIQNAPRNSAVLLLADKYPEQTTYVEPSEFDLAREKNLRLFLEYPAALPGMEVAMPLTATWERLVVSSENFSPALPKLRILGINDCHFTPVIGSPKADVVLARVAGFDTAVFGIPEKKFFPMLFELPGKKLTVAATKLSGFVAGRYGPVREWQILWEKILAKLDPQDSPKLNFQPVVTPAFRADEKLPRKFERKAFAQAVKWFSGSHLLVAPSRQQNVALALSVGMENTPPPDPDEPIGDGSLGIMEGYASGILSDGNQFRRLPLRCDCNAESAMVLALEGSRKNSRIAKNLLDFVYFNSGMCAGVRADPKHPAFGLIGWGDIAPAWLVANYGDDNARTMLSTILVGACLKEKKWDEVVMRALLANFRTTGKFGFRGDRIDIPALEQNGWKHFHDAPTVNYSPHFEGYLWACNLWAYRQTGFRPFLDKTKTAIAMTMKVYPAQWRWQDNLERAHMLLSLAWLVRVEDTSEHREWLERVANDLLRDQQSNGAIRERRDHVEGGHYQVPQSNEAYGTGETPLIQKNGDPVSDQLYTTGFALLGLHEAAFATGDIDLKHAEDKLAEFLCRIQTRSKKIPYANGTWFRAFDDSRWDFWASSADAGWGAWSLEAGWGQAWIPAVLALREKKTTFWDFTENSRVVDHFEKLKVQMEIGD